MAFNIVRTPLKILVVRRDNIGDLICTTPLLHGLRGKYPEAWISVLASSYNREVLDGNPDVNEVLVFLKKKQKSHGYGRLGMLWNRWQLLRSIRKQRFDHVILANGGWRYGHTLGGRQTIGFREPGEPDHRQPDVLAPDHGGFDEHEVSKMATLGSILGVEEALGPLRVFPNALLVLRQRQLLLEAGWNPERPSIAFHISARKAERRWNNSSFVDLAKNLTAIYGVQVLFFWSPGGKNHLMHPGDDEDASLILNSLRKVPVFPCPSDSIAGLIAGLSLADQVVCSDGGGMHVAAALQKPVLCFFGPSEMMKWHPWGVPYVHLQKPSLQVSDITVMEALAGFDELQGKIASGLSLI